MQTTNTVAKAPYHANSSGSISSSGFSRERQSFGPTGSPQYRDFYGRGEYRWAIYPDNWKESWGKAPLLGIVSADDEFLAERLAYDKGILSPNNCTFQPRFRNLGVNRRYDGSINSTNSTTN